MLPAHIKAEIDAANAKSRRGPDFEARRRMTVMQLARYGKYGTQQAIANAMKLTQGRVAQLKKSAIEGGLFTETQWRSWLRRNRAAHRLGKEI